MAGRYASSIGWEFRGDVALAQTYMPLARKLVGFELERAALLRLQFASFDKLYENGLNIAGTAVRHLGKPVIVRCIIDVSRVIEAVETLLPLLNGLADPLVGTGLYAARHYLTDGVPQLNQFYPKESPRAWRKEPGLAQSAPNDYQPAKDYPADIPGKYSGEMRAVVQDITSREQTNPFSFKFGDTHGIYTAADGVKWVIEIGRSTIRAAKLETRFATDNTDKLASLDYVPLPTKLTSLTWHTINIVGNMPEDNPFFSECGWAFSYNGSKASNVFTKLRTDSPNNPGLTYGYSWLYTISFTEEDNIPASATVAEVKSGWLFGDRQQHFKYPKYGSESLTSYDWFAGNYSPPWTGANTAPIHCWYSGEALQECNAVDDPGETQTYSGTYSGVTVANIESGHTWGSYTDITGAYDCFESPLHAAYEASSGSGSLKGELEAAHSYPITEISANQASPDAVIWRAKEVIDSSYVNAAGDCLIIPMNDRESIGHYRELTQTETGGEVLYPETAWYLPEGAIVYDAVWHDACFDLCGLSASTVTLNLATPNPTSIIFGPNIVDATEAEEIDNLGLCCSYYPVGDDSLAGTTAEAAAQNWVTSEGIRLGQTWVLTSVAAGSGSPAVGDDKYTVYYTVNGDPRTSVDRIYHRSLKVAYPHDLVDRNDYQDLVADPLPDTDTSSESAKLWVDVGAKTLPVVATETNAEWEYYISDTQNYYQWFIAGVDASGTIGPIYLTQPVSSRSSWSFSDKITGPSTYPCGEIQKSYPRFVGNPGELT